MSEVTLDHHLYSFGEGDVEGLLEDFTEDSTIIIPNAIIKGLDEIRDFFVNMTTEVLPPGSEYELLDKVVDENIGYIVWHAESDLYKIPFGSNTFVFEDEKILVQTVAFILHEKI